VFLQLLEFELQLTSVECPNLRVFPFSPRLLVIGMTAPQFRPYCYDHVDLMGMLALHISQPRADYLKGTLVSVNWDVEEIEAQENKIVEKKLLKPSGLPVLPVFGGEGLMSSELED
jgi:hypothetical protein